jgi:hypothetical protein
MFQPRETSVQNSIRVWRVLVLFVGVLVFSFLQTVRWGEHHVFLLRAPNTPQAFDEQAKTIAGSTPTTMAITLKPANGMPSTSSFRNWSPAMISANFPVFALRTTIANSCNRWDINKSSRKIGQNRETHRFWAVIPKIRAVIQIAKPKHVVVLVQKLAHFPRADVDVSHNLRIIRSPLRQPTAATHQQVSRNITFAEFVRNNPHAIPGGAGS